MSGDSVRPIAERVRELTLENEKLFRELVSAERRFRSLSRAVWSVQEEERRRLARELHDGIGQTLTALKNQLAGARRSGSSPEATAESIDAALAMASQALRDTRELSRLLRPAVLDDLGLMPALRWLARNVGERLAIEVELSLQGIEERLDREIETLAFRVVQEALTNVAKHSGASRASVQVIRAGGRLTIGVSDAGAGFDPHRVFDAEHREGAVGLRGIRDRAELFGGSMRIDAGPGRGTRIEVAVPIAAEETGP